MADAGKRIAAAAGLAGLLGGLWRLWPRCCDADVGAWTDSPTWTTTGHMGNVAAFRDFVSDHDPCWRHYPIDMSLALLGVDPGGDAPTTPVLVERTPGAGSGEVDVSLTYESAGDDSVAATRYRFTYVDEQYVGGTAGVFRLLEGIREFRCHPGRGHEDWGADPCL